jgi:hypothetical protein
MANRTFTDKFIEELCVLAENVIRSYILSKFSVNYILNLNVSVYARLLDDGQLTFDVYVELTLHPKFSRSDVEAVINEAVEKCFKELDKRMGSVE